MIIHNNYSLFVNTTDSFEDCWIPFFTLFKKYWPDYTGKIYLNTETKVFTFPGLDIVSVQNNINTPNKKITWSECLIRALNSIENEVILYMQEDYFLKDFVKNDLVKKYAQMMEEHSDIQCIHLTDQAVRAESRSEYDHLDKVALNQRYRVSCQAALWHKSELLDLVRKYEDAWEFEEFGSKRSALLERDYLEVNREYVKLNHFDIIPYIFTGIIQGRWHEETVPLFHKHDIVIDFTKRGFVNEAPSKPFMKRIKYKLNKIPNIVRNRMELRLLKLK